VSSTDSAPRSVSTARPCTFCRISSDFVALVEQLAVEHGRAVAQLLGDHVPVGGVRDDHEAVLAGAVDDEVVDHSARAVQQERVLRSADGDGAQVARERVVQGVHRLGADDQDLAHVGEVEEAGGGAHRVVLGEIAGVAHRHPPAGEVGEGGAGRHVHVVQRGAARLGGLGGEGRSGLGHEFSNSSQCCARARTGRWCEAQQCRGNSPSVGMPERFTSLGAALSPWAASSE
jgi:hypothetical protein